jgi:hypothetical protein
MPLGRLSAFDVHIDAVTRLGRSVVLKVSDRAAGRRIIKFSFESARTARLEQDRLNSWAVERRSLVYVRAGAEGALVDVEQLLARACMPSEKPSD